MADIIINDRTTTWSAIGKSVEECKDVAQVLAASGLDYEVEKRPVYTQRITNMGGTFDALPNRYVTVRKIDDHPYDVISDKFEIVQNRDAFDFVNYMGDDLRFLKAGETQSGMVYIIGALPEMNILGDTFTPHVIFKNGFDGKHKIMAAICPLRMVCQNQFNFAFKNAANAMTIRHVQNAESKLVEARETLRLCADYMTELNIMAERFATMKITGDRAERIVDYLFPIPDDSRVNPFKLKTLEESRTRLRRAIDADDNANFKNTAWGMINAYTDFITHKEPAGKREDRFEGKFVNTTLKISMNPIIGAIEATA